MQGVTLMDESSNELPRTQEEVAEAKAVEAVRLGRVKLTNVENFYGYHKDAPVKVFLTINNGSNECRAKRVVQKDCPVCGHQVRGPR